jgi:hypothetical protein
MPSISIAKITVCLVPERMKVYNQQKMLHRRTLMIWEKVLNYSLLARIPKAQLKMKKDSETLGAFFPH